LIQMKAIKPKHLKVGPIRLELLNEMRKQGRLIANTDFKRTVRTWKGDKPKFVPKISLKGGAATMDLKIVAEGDGADKWRYLDEGTKVRRALMSDDWKSKTVPDVFDSRPGKGRVVFISKSLELPGIKARNWSKMALKKWKRPYAEAMQAAIERGAAKARK
jgi:hypothetical protein